MHRFEDLEALVAVVEAGTFTAAADRLGIAKSAVSRRIASLEARLGAELLRRTTRRISLTDTGRAFYERSVRILADLDEAEAAVAMAHGQLRGRLRIVLPMSFGIRHMYAPIATFGRRHPKIHFDLDLNDRRVDLIEEGADLAIRIGRLPDSSLIARRLFEARAVVCAAPSYIAEHGAPETPEELAQHACLAYANVPDPGTWSCTDGTNRRRVVDVNVTMTASSGDFLCASAAEGMGVTMQPTFIAGEAIRAGMLVPILRDYRWPVTPAYALYPPARQLSSRVRAFIDYLAEHFAGTPYWDSDCENC